MTSYKELTDCFAEYASSEQELEQLHEEWQNFVKMTSEEMDQDQYSDELGD